ncbi:hypothetical protein Pcinc_015592 [Petrolisthes cinctipes]|uniref:THAP-type domain-containing protein n=1 Tax=Petrolisthes cinctipes TaxID=88211 RepID=A0AAE1FU40_PETCI|nr:hypothetical protein Pcinc_024975 [Petrolisthes cinctipes]KAK3879866.1 hypothetical protein Pcinc_015592 [Petrolisthes cinctipes]
MPNTCIVRGCKSVTVRGGDIRFHTLPKDNELKRKWLKLCGASTNYSYTLGRVCSRHFDSTAFERNMKYEKGQNTVGAELRKNRGASFCKICSVFLTHHKKIQPLLKLLLLEELNNLNFIVPIAALSLRIPPSKPSC